MRLFEIISYHLKNSSKREIAKMVLLNLRFYLYWLSSRKKNVKNINNFERKIYSQNGEDGILQLIFYKIGTTNKYFVEFGVEDGSECNTRFLKERFGWKGLWMDAGYGDGSEVKKERVTKENIERLFKKYRVPKKFDLLSIDIDGNDYWVWEAIMKYNPRVVVVEYNSMIQPPISKTIKYDPCFTATGTDYFGASLSALNKLAKKKGYILLGCENKGINAFFVKKEITRGSFIKKSVQELYKPPKFGSKINGKFVGYSKSEKKMITV